MPYTRETTGAQLRQMVDDLEARNEIAVQQYRALAELYQQAMADKAKMETVLIQNSIPIPYPVTILINDQGNTAADININPNTVTWDSSNDIEVPERSKGDKDAPSSGSVNRVATPFMPSWQDQCTRKHCNGKSCRMVHDDQMKHYGKIIIEQLPFRIDAADV